MDCSNDVIANKLINSDTKKEENMKELFKFAFVIFTLFTLTPAYSMQVCNNETRVPSTSPTIHFEDNGDGTVTDKKTGLMWKQCSEGHSGGLCIGTATMHDWKSAIELAHRTVFAGYSDWRLPNINELRSIVEQRCAHPAINLLVFPNTASTYYWSSSPSARNKNESYDVNFNWGNAGSYYRVWFFGVRLVRN